MTALLENRPPDMHDIQEYAQVLDVKCRLLANFSDYKVSHHVIRRSTVPLVGISVQKCPMFMTVLSSSDVRKAFPIMC